MAHTEHDGPALRVASADAAGPFDAGRSGPAGIRRLIARGPAPPTVPPQNCRR
jgi:hypothetical protein